MIVISFFTLLTVLAFALWLAETLIVEHDDTLLRRRVLVDSHRPQVVESGRGAPSRRAPRPGTRVA